MTTEKLARNERPTEFAGGDKIDNKCQRFPAAIATNLASRGIWYYASFCCYPYPPVPREPILSPGGFAITLGCEYIEFEINQ